MLGIEMMNGVKVSDEMLGTFAPIIVYWLYSGIYVLLGSLDDYRLHTRKDEDEKNLVSKSDVVKGVLLQQAVQAVVASLLFAIWNLPLCVLVEFACEFGDLLGWDVIGIRLLKYFFDLSGCALSSFRGCVLCSIQRNAAVFPSVVNGPSHDYIVGSGGLNLMLAEVVITGSDSNPAHAQVTSLIVLARQFLVGMMVLDTWQYFMHRYMHQNKFLYKHIHSQHHRLVVPYAFGALYNHPIEGLLLDTVGGALSFLVSGMSPRASIFFFSFATLKTVDDHCGLWLPGNLFHLLFRNNSAYHDIHHQLYGNKYNFSQPFLVMWDRILGTYMPYSLEKNINGGFEARPSKEYKED
ncbi:hypothetical protein SASPL_130860 [Salvia splendens]|uniref:Fatty acid hydroxylase domain-containing protein n=1 Tax=Salvia splendens TaxID=180675 RepID=A0A8X8X6T1_SALSN|nr:hypothetical protein SASPL_130860 [Salvia splendens]